MFCPNCGNQIKDNVKFCPKCGVKISDDTVKEKNILPMTGTQEKSSFSAPAKEKRSPSTPPSSGKKPKKGGKKTGILVIALLLVLAVCAGTGYYVSQKKEADRQEREEENKKKRGEEKEEKKEEKAEDEEVGILTDKSSEPADTQAPATEAVTESHDLITASVSYSSQIDFSGLSRIILQKEKVTQSSFVVQQSSTIDNTGWSAFDGNPETSWQEGQPDDGIGEYVMARFDRDYQVKNITFLLGNHRSDEWYEKNNRPKRISILLGGQRFEAEFPDEMSEFTVVLSEPVSASDITVMIDEVYCGTEYQDTVIAEIGVYGN